MRHQLRFLLNGKVEEIGECRPTDTVLDYLRETKRLTGTKEGCAEGDCGACTVVVAEHIEGTLQYRAFNSCILFLPTLDGKQLITVEALENSGELHTVQQALVDQHGSQCGFCTPGFAMSMLAMFHDRDISQPQKATVDAELAGNLCRCTGYAPIFRAVQQAFETRIKDQFAQGEPETINQLQAIQSNEMLRISSGRNQFLAPLNLTQLCQVLEENKDAVIVAGATDVGLWVTKQLQQLQTLVYTGRVQELQEIVEDGNSGTLTIGAAVSYTDAMPALLEHWPGLEEVLTRLGARQVRNAGTIGGNIANGSPIGDMPPALIALDAQLLIASSHGERTIRLEDFFIDYGKQDLAPGECISRIIIPLPESSMLFNCYKISKRIEQDISAVCAAFCVELADGTVSRARVAYGGMAATPKRANNCESALVGKSWSLQTVETAMEAMQEDFTPITDMRASAGYRMAVAANLLKRFFLESSDSPSQIRLVNTQGAMEEGQEI
jgi:xanthine dehydrogenase small subunit